MRKEGKEDLRGKEYRCIVQERVTKISVSYIILFGNVRILLEKEESA